MFILGGIASSGLGLQGAIRQQLARSRFGTPRFYGHDIAKILRTLPADWMSQQSEVETGIPPL